MRLADLKIDDDFKNLLPELDAETYTDLEKDIVTNGMFDPIITWHGFIADGHNRYEICKAHRIEDVQTKELSKPTKSAVMQWIVDHQYARRILLKSEKVKALLKVEEQIAKEAEQKHVDAMAKAREKRWSEQSASNLTETDKLEEPKQRAPETAEIMAKKMGVSKNTWKDAKLVVKEGTPKQIERMDKGGLGNGISTIAREIKDGVNENERKCIKCGKILPIAEFRDRKNKYVCRECVMKRLYAAHGIIEVMPDTLNPDVKEEITDDIIVAKFKNILVEATDTFETMLKYEQHMTDSVMDELINVINEHINKMNEVKEKMANETEG